MFTGLKVWWYSRRLRSKDDRVRSSAVDRLIKLGTARAVDPLITALGDVNLRVCQPAAEALGKFGDLRAVAPLIKVLSDGDSNASFCAARALTTFGVEIAIQPLIKALTGASWYACRKTAAELLGQLRDIRAVEPLVRALVDADADVRQGGCRGVG